MTDYKGQTAVSILDGFTQGIVEGMKFKKQHEFNLAKESRQSDQFEKGFKLREKESNARIDALERTARTPDTKDTFSLEDQGKALQGEIKQSKDQEFRVNMKVDGLMGEIQKMQQIGGDEASVQPLLERVGRLEKQRQELEFDRDEKQRQLGAISQGQQKPEFKSFAETKEGVQFVSALTNAKNEGEAKSAYMMAKSTGKLTARQQDEMKSFVKDKLREIEQKKYLNFQDEQTRLEAPVEIPFRR